MAGETCQQVPTRFGTREVRGPGDPPRRTVKATGREQGRKCPLQTLGQVRGQRCSPDSAHGRAGSAGSEGTLLGRGRDLVPQADPPPPPAMRPDRVTQGPTLPSRSPAMPSGNRAAQLKAGRKEGQRRTLGSARKRKPLSSPLDLRKPPGLASKNRSGGGEGLRTPRASPAGGSQSSLLLGGEHRPPPPPGAQQSRPGHFLGQLPSLPPTVARGPGSSLLPRPKPTPPAERAPRVGCPFAPLGPCAGVGGACGHCRPKAGLQGATHTSDKEGLVGWAPAAEGERRRLGQGRGQRRAEGPWGSSGCLANTCSPQARAQPLALGQCHAMPHHPVAAWSQAGPEPQRLKEGPWFPACSYHFKWATWDLRLLIAPYRQGKGAGEFHMG